MLVRVVVTGGILVDGKTESKTARLLVQIIRAGMVSVFAELTLRRNSMGVERMNSAGNI